MIMETKEDKKRTTHLDIHFRTIPGLKTQNCPLIFTLSARLFLKIDMRHEKAILRQRNQIQKFQLSFYMCVLES